MTEPMDLFGESGGHLVVDEAVRAQFGDAFRSFRALRIRRNELEYPALPADRAEESEAGTAVENAARIIEAVREPLPHVGFF